MRKVMALFSTVCVALGCMNISANAAVQKDDVRAAWVSTVYNMDYPQTKNNETAQKKEFIELLDDLKSVGLNTVIVQVRPKGDALYKSKINPWSDVLTGVQGKDPGYDPLEFMVNEAHKRGMEFHAWLNPYRVTTSGTDLNVLASNHPARKNPSWVLSHNNALFYNPELPAVRQHIADTVKEIVQNYNVDAIHFDDYFYPGKYPLPDGEGRDGVVANKRRDNVNKMVSMVKDTIRSIKPNVKFGISPVGIWKNKSSDSTGSDTRGYESYYDVYADTRTWIKNGWIDYVIPQIYWETGHSAADYETLVKWWSNEVKGTKVDLYVGHGVYKDAVASEIDKQLVISDKYNVSGNSFFSTRDVRNNRAGGKEKIKSYYKKIDDAKPKYGYGKIVNVQNGTTVDVKKNPKDSSKGITKVPVHGGFDILGTSGDWYKVKFYETVGYIHYSNVEVLNGPFKVNKMVVPSKFNYYGFAKAIGISGNQKAPIRESMSSGSEVIDNMPYGAGVDIIGAYGNWYKVKYYSSVGYIESKYIEILSGDIAIKASSNPGYGKVVNDSSVYIKDTNSSTGKSVNTMGIHAGFDVLGSSGRWYKVKFYDHVGYIHAKNTEILKGSTLIPTYTQRFAKVVGINGTDKIPVYRDTNVISDEIAYMTYGAGVDIVGSIGDWYECKFYDAIGYVPKEYIQILK